MGGVGGWQQQQNTDGQLKSFPPEMRTINNNNNNNPLGLTKDKCFSRVERQDVRVNKSSNPNYPGSTNY